MSVSINKSTSCRCRCSAVACLIDDKKFKSKKQHNSKKKNRIVSLDSMDCSLDSEHILPVSNKCRRRQGNSNTSCFLRKNVGKEENAGYQYFLLFSYLFSKAFLLRVIKTLHCTVKTEK